ncbi:class I lanthipeptide [Chitinophaga solisilvae]|uniref:Uncharacterized protein n=1 Tax=Chitinophaga solisilvae TaxID=1233460 RepID=A0A9Q5DA35_9BACT|nr:class I lanthipeptide [Chitinophaga solisilvae]NSL86667.1 hypothetical protein [Chitinophaga solisilvae]
MKKAPSKKLRLTTIRVTTLTQQQQQEIKGGAATLNTVCTRYRTCVC